MTGRPRTSTIVLIGLFVGVFALYILVRPQSAPAGATQPASGNTPSYVPARSPASAHPASPTRSPSPSPHRTATLGPGHSPTPLPTSS